LSELLPQNKSFYHYAGSLTTPPCSEVVNWYILKNNITASAMQLSQFSSILKNNFRNIQDLNGRTIYSRDE
jgi:carbonic anhydrase